MAQKIFSVFLHLVLFSEPMGPTPTLLPYPHVSLSFSLFFKHSHLTLLSLILYSLSLLYKPSKPLSHYLPQLCEHCTRGAAAPDHHHHRQLCQNTTHTTPFSFWLLNPINLTFSTLCPLHRNWNGDLLPWPALTSLTHHQTTILLSLQTNSSLGL